MFQNFRLSMAWLHTWFGLVLGFVLMAAFFFGALSVFDREIRSEEHTSELQSLVHISYAVFCLKKHNWKLIL